MSEQMQPEYREGEWRIVRRRGRVGGGFLQPMLFKHGEWIPLGPWADDIEEMRTTLASMAQTCDAPILEGVQH